MAPIRPTAFTAMRKSKAYKDLASYFRWQAKWGPRFQTLFLIVTAGFSLVALAIAAVGLWTGEAASLQKYQSESISRADEPLIYWIFMCYWLSMAMLFGTLAARSVLGTLKQKSRFW